MRRRRKSKPHMNHERWLVSYADFITLMFAFFVVLFATSQSDKKKQAEVSQSINQAFQALGLFPPGEGSFPCEDSCNVRGSACYSGQHCARR